jgi:Icc-related predicted phosphoesterase
MRAWIFSDIHLEFDKAFKWPRIPDADVCICAGDITDGGIVPSIEWLVANVLQSMPVVFIPGNHEFYRSSVKEGLESGYAAMRRHKDFYLLDGDWVEFDDCRIVGATLWTDFNLVGVSKLSMYEAKEKMTDYKRIKLSKSPFKRFTPEDSRSLHREALYNIDQFYRSPSDKPTVVVTHHAPSILSVPRGYLRDPLTPAFTSNLLLQILEYRPVLWVHGHIHTPCDYRVGDTRIVCNPLGYPGEPSRETFNHNLVIDIAKLARS